MNRFYKSGFYQFQCSQELATDVDSSVPLLLAKPLKIAIKN